jgi:hypothetical protein
MNRAIICKEEYKHQHTNRMDNDFINTFKKKIDKKTVDKHELYHGYNLTGLDGDGEYFMKLSLLGIHYFVFHNRANNIPDLDQKGAFVPILQYHYFDIDEYLIPNSNISEIKIYQKEDEGFEYARFDVYHNENVSKI